MGLRCGFGDQSESHLPCVFKLETYISSTKIHFTLTAKLFVHLEAAVVSKTKALCLLFMALTAAHSNTASCLSSTDPIGHSSSDCKRVKKGQCSGTWCYQPYSKIRTHMFVCLSIGKKNMRKNIKPTHNARNF